MNVSHLSKENQIMWNHFVRMFPHMVEPVVNVLAYKKMGILLQMADGYELVFNYHDRGQWRLATNY